MNFYILLLALISYIALASATTPHMDDINAAEPNASATTTNAAPARRQRFGFGLGRKV
jgi:hypothetical protein